MRIVQFVYVFLLALVVGVFWGTWFSLSRSIASITPATFLEIGRTMIGNLGEPMRVLMPAALVSSLPVIVWRYRQRRTAACALAVLSLVLFTVALIVTLTINVPIDYQIRSWTVETLPADWMAIRDRWEYFHGVRTLASVAGFGCAVASVLVGSDQPGDATNVRPRQAQPAH